MAVSARPVALLPLLAGRPEREQSTATMKNALQLVSEVFGQAQGRQPVLNQLLSDDAVNNPRNGLRRWVIGSLRMRKSSPAACTYPPGGVRDQDQRWRDLAQPRAFERDQEVDRPSRGPVPARAYPAGG